MCSVHLCVSVRYAGTLHALCPQALAGQVLRGARCTFAYGASHVGYGGGMWGSRCITCAEIPKVFGNIPSQI